MNPKLRPKQDVTLAPAQVLDQSVVCVSRVYVKVLPLNTAATPYSRVMAISKQLTTEDREPLAQHEWRAERAQFPAAASARV